MMAMPAIFCVTVIIIAGLSCFTEALRLRRRRFPTTTTTTTTPTTTLGIIVDFEERPVPEEHCPCCEQESCMAEIERSYFPFLYNHDFALLTESLDTLCDVDLPATLQCLSNFQRRDCAISHLMIAPWLQFCSIRESMEEGLPCWANGFQPMMQNCMDQLQPGFKDPCQDIRDLKVCVDVQMNLLPLCLPQDVHLVLDYVRNSTISFCPDQ